MVSPENDAVLQLNRDLRDAWAAAPDPTYGETRRIFEEWLADFEIPADATFEQVDAGGVPATWVDTPGGDTDRVVIHLHSGGYLLGSARGYRSFGGFLAGTAGMRVLLPDYRLAPEHPFPAAVEDSLAAYQWVLGQGVDPAQIVIAGDSAGGGLTLVTLQAARDEGLPLPAGGVSISPLADFAHTGESRTTNDGLDPLVRRPQLDAMGLDYYGTHDPREPRISPLYGRWEDLPPILFMAGSIEVLRDDATQCAQAARDAGVDAQYVEGEGMSHIWPIYADRLPEAREALSTIGEFVRSVTRAGR